MHLFYISEIHTVQGTNISPPKGTLEADVPNFPFGGICDRSLEGTHRKYIPQIQWNVIFWASHGTTKFGSCKFVVIHPVLFCCACGKTSWWFQPI